MITEGGRAEFLGRVNARVESLAAKPAAAWAMFAFAFVEASLFPIPPDLLFLPMSALQPRRSFAYAGLCVAGSVSGAFVGYLIGGFFRGAIATSLIGVSGAGAQFAGILESYRVHSLPVLLLAGFTAIPFSLFTIAAGWSGVDYLTFGCGVLAGRMLRFFLIAAVLYLFAPAIRNLLGKYLAWSSLALGVVLVVAIAIGRWVF